MRHTQRIPIAIRLPGGLKWFLFAWLLSEIAAFALVVHLLGWGGTILLGLATSVLGIMMLRRIGTDAARALRRAMEGAQPPNGALLDGMLGALGAVMLILPGFVANIAGCALASPSGRRWAARLFDGNVVGPAAGPRVGRRSPADVIDLAPEDWRIVDRG